MRYPGGQTQPEMHGVLGGQVRFNIRLRQVGAQATPPLCSAQLWYTFPSGHSPTSPLSASVMCTHTVPQNETHSCPNLTASASQSWETSYKGIRLETTARGRQPETELCCWKEQEQELKGGGVQGGYLYLLAHTPSSHFCTGWRTDHREGGGGE